MSPATQEKVKGWAAIAQAALTPLVAIVAILAVMMIAPMYLRSDEGLDRWTGSQHTEYSKLVDERIDHVGKQIDALQKTVAAHVAMEMHHGARVQFTKITAELRHMTEALDRIEKRLEKVDGG